MPGMLELKTVSNKEIVDAVLHLVIYIFLILSITFVFSTFKYPKVRGVFFHLDPHPGPGDRKYDFIY